MLVCAQFQAFCFLWDRKYSCTVGGWSDGLEKKNPLNNHIKVRQSRNIFSKWFTVLFIVLTQFLRVGCNKDFYLLFPVYQDFSNASGTSHAASKSESVHIRKWSLQSFTAWWTQRWEKCGYITQAVDIRCCLTLLGLIHQQFLRINLFLSLTYAFFTKIVAFINVFSPRICSLVQ